MRPRLDPRRSSGVSCPDCGYAEEHLPVGCEMAGFGYAAKVFGGAVG
jgi:hypothetical protein